VRIGVAAVVLVATEAAAVVDTAAVMVDTRAEETGIEGLHLGVIDLLGSCL
jgi:hypothetical protein